VTEGLENTIKIILGSLFQLFSSGTTVPSVSSLLLRNTGEKVEFSLSYRQKLHDKRMSQNSPSEHSGNVEYPDERQAEREIFSKIE